MKAVITLFRFYFRSLSLFSPSFAAKQALLLFQKPRKHKLKKREQAFYQKAKKFNVQWDDTVINYYGLGSSKNSLVVLVHGWESNAGSMAGIAMSLVDKGFYTISIEHPAHGINNQIRTNLFDSASALKSVLNELNPTEGFSLIAHSFGSAVSTIALQKSPFSINQLIYLTSPNQIIRIFEEYKAIVALPGRTYEKMLKMVVEKFSYGIDILEFSVEDKVKSLNYSKLSLIHDEHDKVLPFVNSEIIAGAASNSRLHKMNKVGHYRMLWTDEVYKIILETLSSPSLSVKKEKPLISTE